MKTNIPPYLHPAAPPAAGEQTGSEARNPPPPAAPGAGPGTAGAAAEPRAARDRFIERLSTTAAADIADDAKAPRPPAGGRYAEQACAAPPPGYRSAPRPTHRGFRLGLKLFAVSFAEPSGLSGLLQALRPLGDAIVACRPGGGREGMAGAPPPGQLIQALLDVRGGAAK